MRHHNQNRKFGRTQRERQALLASLARSLVLREKIKTTEAKAKELRPFVEKLIGYGKTGELAKTRLLQAKIGKEAGQKLVKTISPRYSERRGGYVRIIKLPTRKSDASQMAQIEFV